MQLHIARPAAYSLLATAGLQAHPGGTYWKRRQQNHEAWDTSAAGSPTKIGTPQRPKQTASLHYPAAPARQAFPTVLLPPKAVCAALAIRLGFRHHLITSLQMKSLYLSQHRACWYLICCWSIYYTSLRCLVLSYPFEFTELTHLSSPN